MCLIAIAWRQSARYPLVIAANRDEAHERPTLPAGRWPDAPDIYGGRDLHAGGSWLALTADGKLAAVTNVRGAARVEGGRSRGHLVRDYLLGGGEVERAARACVASAPDYGPFNLLLCDGRELVHVSNRPAVHWSCLPSGIHGVSNGALNAPWPKVLRLTERLRSFMAGLDRDDGDPELEPLFHALRDTTEAPAGELPDTGVGMESERRLSPPFVSGDNYGTRASTVALLHPRREARLIERSFDAAGQLIGEQRLVLPV
jgi:uncharacterized protein with NRDE domain